MSSILILPQSHPAIKNYTISGLVPFNLDSNALELSLSNIREDSGHICIFDEFYWIDLERNVWRVQEDTLSFVSNIAQLHDPFACGLGRKSELVFFSWNPELKFMKSMTFNTSEVTLIPLDPLNLDQIGFEVYILNHPTNNIFYMVAGSQLYTFDMDSNLWNREYIHLGPFTSLLLHADGTFYKTDKDFNLWKYQEELNSFVDINKKLNLLTSKSTLKETCSQAKDCWTCAPLEGCTWCLSVGQCQTEEECKFTGQKDCCIINPNCETCTQFEECVFCTGPKSGCFSGDSNGPNNEPCTEWDHKTCTKKTPGTNPVVMGIIISIGSGFVIMSIVLLVLLVRRLYWQRRARQAAIFSKITCQWCQDGIAVVECLDCKLKLCSHCCEAKEVHPEGVKHVIVELSTSVQNINSDRYDSEEDKYTSFASLLHSRYTEPEYDQGKALQGK